MQKQFLGTISALVAIVTLAGAQTPGVARRGTTLETVGVSRGSGSRINIEITTNDETTPWVETLDHPARIVVDLPNTVLAAGLHPIPVGVNGVKGIRIGTDAEKTTRVVVDLARLCGYEFVPGSGHHLILKVDPTSPAPALAAEGGSSGAPVRGASVSSQSPPSQSAARSVVTPSAPSNSAPAAAALPANADVQTSTEVVRAQPSPTAAGLQGSNGGAAPPAQASAMVASAQPNVAQPDPPGNPAVPASEASGGGAGAPPSIAARGSETGAAPRGMVVGGHIGAVFPLVTHANGTTTSISDSFSIGMPVGITLHGQGRTAFDMEFVPVVQNSPRQVSLTLHPGVLYGIGHGFTLGMRAAFVASSSQFGFTPLVNKSWPIEGGSFFKAYFIEADLPVRFDRPQGLPGSNAVTFAMHFGLGF